MAIRYRPDVTPAEGDDAVAFIARQLRQDATVQTGLLNPTGEKAGVHEGQRPAEQATRFVIVRELREIGGRVEYLSGLDRVPIQIITSCPQDLGHRRQWHRVMHRVIRETLVGQSFSEGHSQTEQPIRRTRKPVSLTYSTQTGQSEQMAQYDVVLAPQLL